jgi:hypothetical protein
VTCRRLGRGLRNAQQDIRVALGPSPSRQVPRYVLRPHTSPRTDAAPARPHSDSTARTKALTALCPETTFYPRRAAGIPIPKHVRGSQLQYSGSTGVPGEDRASDSRIFRIRPVRCLNGLGRSGQGPFLARSLGICRANTRKDAIRTWSVAPTPRSRTAGCLISSATSLRTLRCPPRGGDRSGFHRPGDDREPPPPRARLTLIERDVQVMPRSTGR